MLGGYFMSQNTTVVVQSTKSVGVSLILTFLFGSLGMLYSTVIGAIIMIVIELIIGVLTFGLGLIFTHAICMVWGAIAANQYNKKLLHLAKQ
jgi:hypothetical protein